MYKISKNSGVFVNELLIRIYSLGVNELLIQICQRTPDIYQVYFKK
jgi:hypothetical protein